MEAKEKIKWEKYIDVKNRLKDLPFDFENEQRKVMESVKKMKRYSVIGTYKKFLKFENELPEDPFELLKDKTSGYELDDFMKHPIPYRKIVETINTFKEIFLNEEDSDSVKDYKEDVTDSEDEQNEGENEEETLVLLKEVPKMCLQELVSSLNTYRSKIVKEIKGFKTLKELEKLFVINVIKNIFCPFFCFDPSKSK